MFLVLVAIPILDLGAQKMYELQISMPKLSSYSKTQWETPKE